MRRMLGGQIIETQEEMAECGLHDGTWDNQGGFCVIHDEDEYAGYIEHVRVPEPVDTTGWYDEQAEEVEVVDISQEPPLADGERQELDEILEEANRLTYTGISPDSPTTQNENGGLQSVVEGRFDLLPPVAMFELAKVMEHGAMKYAPKNWMKISVDSHLNHLLMHVFAYLAGDRQEEHLTHALARAAMAVEIEKLGVQE